MNERLQSIKNERLLWIALGLTLSFVAFELIGSFLSHSLTLLSDAAHLFADAAALVVSIIAMRLGRLEADHKRTYGYYRFEILAAALNAIVLFLVAIFIFIEAYQRFYIQSPIQTKTMFIVACFGVLINFFSVSLLRKASQEHLTIKSAYIDAQADLFSAIAVIFTAILIKFTQWHYLDSVMAIGIALWILPRTWSLLKESINILLEGVPEGIEISAIQAGLSSLKEIKEVHDIHVWALNNKKVSLTAHVVVQPTCDQRRLLKVILHFLEERFHINHSTIQIEYEPCNHRHD